VPQLQQPPEQTVVLVRLLHQLAAVEHQAITRHHLPGVLAAVAALVVTLVRLDLLGKVLQVTILLLAVVVSQSMAVAAAAQAHRVLCNMELILRVALVRSG
jgi:hypothetical protein